jgi:quinol-cytochrome oxidoreductase complex cytochrome b subunit
MILSPKSDSMSTLGSMVTVTMIETSPLINKRVHHMMKGGRTVPTVTAAERYGVTEEDQTAEGPV